MDGKDILQTLIELLEVQEQIKIQYTVRESEEPDECDAIPPPVPCA